MEAREVRTRFLEFFERRNHTVLASSPLVPQDDPTLLFVNAGMVQFKRIFLGLEASSAGRRATTSQKCVRAGGKHNDLEQVGHTARHHTFFEMLGNFSFGDYFKRDAISFAWEFLTETLGLDRKHLRVSVFEEDDEARALWKEVAGLPDSRIYGLGAHDNFWQMADTGPCGPCSEIYIDLAHVTRDWRLPEGATGEWTDTSREEFSTEAFVQGAEQGRFLEFWNLVFMQYDRQPDGTLLPLPRPSVDTGMGLERTAAILQGESNNYHCDLFLPLLKSIEATTGIPYRPSETSYVHRTTSPVRSGVDAAGQSELSVDPASFRVIADHARAVAFLLADGVFPSNEGRGYVLRRILRRAVRHAWLLGRSEPTLVAVVEKVVDLMGDDYPELRQRARHITQTTRAEEQRFLATIEGGMRRFEELAPAASTQGSADVRGTISGDDAFRLYDTFGFPIDLTELMARERGYTVDIAGFEQALSAQRTQSQQDRRARQIRMQEDATASAEWTAGSDESVRFVGYDRVETDTDVIDVAQLGGGRVAVVLRETPFYAESGGQISDRGTITGDGWSVEVDEVRRLDDRIAAVGTPNGDVKLGRAKATVPRDRRLNTERNHTATHLLHAALREVLGDHVHQAGSLVAPERLRFDFTHHGPLTAEQIEQIEALVNAGIFAAIPVDIREREYREAVAAGAMALFGEKYGDLVRVVSIPGVSAELCGGTHVRNTAEVGLFRIVGETGVASGVRRIEAVTGPGAFTYMRQRDRALDEIESLTRAAPGNAVKRVQALLEERKNLERRLVEVIRAGGSGVLGHLTQGAVQVNGARVIAAEVAAADVKELQSLGDALRERLDSAVAVLASTTDAGKSTLLCVITDDLRERGVRADVILREVAAIAGGRGGGKPHMAQAGVSDPARVPEALSHVEEIVRRHLAGA